MKCVIKENNLNICKTQSFQTGFFIYFILWRTFNTQWHTVFGISAEFRILTRLFFPTGYYSWTPPLELGPILSPVRGVIHYSFSICQGCDWRSVIWSDYHASTDWLLLARTCWINGVISLTDLLCVQRRQIGQLVPRWQLHRYGGDWRGAQGRSADSSWYLLEVPGLHWSSHVPEI